MTKKAIKRAARKSKAKQPVATSSTKQLPAAKPQAKETAAPKVEPGTASQTKPRQSNKPAQSKQVGVVDMLRRAEGTTVAAVMKATGWQKHSVHGFFAGVVRKKLGLELVSEVKGDERIYRIAEIKAAKAAPSALKRAS
jgi:hypothetical protein